MLAVTAAAFIAVMFSGICLKSDFIPLKTFAVAFTMFGTAAVLISPYIARTLNLPITHFVFTQHLRTYTPGSELLAMIAGQLYYFSVATWGLGVLGFCLFVKILRVYTARIKSKPREKSDKTELSDLRHNAKLLTLCVYTFLAVLFTVAISIMNNVEVLSVGLQFYRQEALIFGTYIDSIIPLVLLCTVCTLFMHALDLRTLLATTVVLGGIFTLFFSVAAGTVAHGQSVSVSAILGLYPLRLGVDIQSPITSDTLFLTVSAVFSLMALLIVFISCGGRYKSRILTTAIAVISLYCMVYTCAVYLPYVKGQDLIIVEEEQSPKYESSDDITTQVQHGLNPVEPIRTTGLPEE
jgi:hypothetical protein